MQRLTIGLLCLSWLIWASAVSAQTTGDPTTSTGTGASSSAGTATVQNFSGGGMLNGTYFDVRQVIGDGQGYHNSYSQVGAFMPIWFGDAMIAPITRFIVTNNAQTGVNVGGVGRVYMEGYDRIFGVYGFYDNDQDQFNFRYNQAMFGVETLGVWWDARANGYYVLGNNNNYLSALGVVGANPFYIGNNLAFSGLQLRDAAFSGYDAEVGTPLTPYTPWLRGYAGAYAYQTGTSETIGFRGRIEATVSNDLTLGVMVTQDPLWGTNVNGIIDFKFSGFQPTRYFPNWTTWQRMLNPVQRQWRISTHTYTQQVDVDVINPLTGKPYFITHVDNSAPAGGNGTIEHPYNALQSSPPADIILVHLGNANSAATAVQGSATLTDNQRLLGTGILSVAPAYLQYGSTTINGNINLPGTSNSGLYPYVQNPTGDVVTLGNNNEVAALNLVGSGGSAITNTAAGSNNFSLHDLEISNNAGYGINLMNASGSGISTGVDTTNVGTSISNINVGTTNHANPNGIGNNTLGGIQVTSGAAGLSNLQLTNVNMNSSPVNSQAFGISLSAVNGMLNSTWNNVNTNGNTGSGILLNETNQTLSTVMNMVSSSNNGTQPGGDPTANGVRVTGTGGSINLVANGLTANSNNSDNLQIGTVAAPITNSGNVVANLSNSSFSNSFAGNGILYSISNSVGNLFLTSQTAPPATTANVNGNALNGIEIYTQNSAQFNSAISGILTNVQNASVTGNGGDAFHVVTQTGSIANLVVDPTIATGNTGNGLYYYIGQQSKFGASFTNDQLDSNGISAVYGVVGDATNSFATLSFLNLNGTTGTDSGKDGFYLNVNNNSTVNLVNIVNGQFQNSGVSAKSIPGTYSAFNIAVDNHSNVQQFTTNYTNPVPPANFSFAGNIDPGTGIAGYQSYSLLLNVTNNSNFGSAANPATFQNATLSAANTDFSDNLLNAVNATVNTTSTAYLSLINSNANLSHQDGIVANVDGAGSTLSTSFTNSNINQSNLANVSGNATVGNGVNFSATTGATYLANFNGSTISNNYLNGLLGAVSGGSTATINLASANGLNSDVNSNRDSGINFGVTGGTLTINDSTASISNNGFNGSAGTFSGVYGTETSTTGTSQVNLNFTTMTINSNYDNGVAVTATGNATNSATVNATFNGGTVNMNGLTSTTDTQDGILLNLMNTSPNALTVNTLTVSNNATINGNGYNGIEVDATSAPTFFTTLTFGTGATGVLNATTMTGNGANATVPQSAGAGLSATANGTNAAIILGTMNAVTSGNLAPGGTQQYGLLTTAINAGSISGTIIDTTAGNLNNNKINAINSSVNYQNGAPTATNTLSITSLTLTDTTADNSSAQGALLTVYGGGTLNFVDGSSVTTANNASISNSGGAGVLAFVSDANSSANLNLSYINLNSNGQSFGGQGFSGIAENSGTLNASIANASITGNINQGILINVAGGTLVAPSTARINVNTVLDNSNQGEGVVANALSGAALYYRSQSSQYNQNGVNAAAATVDGVQINATGPNTTAYALFAGDQIDNNNNNGLTLSATQGASLTTSIQGFGAALGTDISSNLGGYGINSIATDATHAGTMFNLLMSGSNTLTSNALGSFSNFGDGVTNFTGINQAVLQLTGSFSNLTGDGVHVDLENMTNAAVDIQGNGTGTIDNSKFNGIFVNLMNITNTGTVLIGGFQEINNSGDDGISVTMNGVNSGALEIDGQSSTVNTNINNSGKSGTGDAVDIHLLDTAGATTLNNGLNTTTPITVQALQPNTTIGANWPGPPSPAGDPSMLQNVLPQPTTFSMNTITPANALVVQGISASGSATNGISIVGDSTGAGVTIHSNPAAQAMIANNVIAGTTNGDGILLHLTNVTTDTTNPYTISTNTVTGASMNGLHIQLDGATGTPISGAGVLPGLTLTNNIIGGSATALNTLDGIRFDLTNSTLNGLTMTGNQVSLSGSNGVEFTSAGGTTPVSSNLTNVAFDSNVINGNTGDGVRINLQTGTNASFTTSSFYGNTIGTSGVGGSPNGGMGVRLVVPNTASFNWNLGDSTQAANLITGNSAAGVGILMTGSGSGTLAVANTTFGNTTAGADLNFTGQGLGIILHDTSTLTSATIGDSTVSTNNTVFSNNAGAGLSINGDTSSVITSLTISNVNSTGNKGDGIDIFQTSTADFSANTITIQNSLVSTNVIGINLQNQYDSHQDTYAIKDNKILSNTSDGMLINVDGDALTVANLTSNMIMSNSGNGINLTETANTNTDNRQISGTWIDNTITLNHQDGIRVAAFSNLTIGQVGNGNTVDTNGFNGIEIDGVSTNSLVTTMIAFNDITGNGTSTTATAFTQKNGIYLNETTVNEPPGLMNAKLTIASDMIKGNLNDGVLLLATSAANLNATIDTSTISGNTQDGVAINASGQMSGNQSGPGTDADGFMANVTIGGSSSQSNNLIENNGGRGVNILNQNNGNSNITVENTSITGNGLQGMYIVNTASADSTLNSSVSVTNLTADGNYFDHAQMKLIVNTNTIEGNGSAATGVNASDTTGLLMLVGTNGAALNTTQAYIAGDGGYASNASQANSLATSSNLTGIGGVLAQINNNTFYDTTTGQGGNAGHDVGFQSFASVSQNSLAPGTTWSTTTFDATNYITDPLARLDMSFKGNVGQDSAVTRAGAFYNSSDGAFKSRLDTASPPGPFLDADRDRNAQQLAGPLPLTPPQPAGANGFLFPGVGTTTGGAPASTFRVTTSSTTGGFLNSGTGPSTIFGGTVPSPDGQLTFGWDQSLMP